MFSFTQLPLVLVEDIVETLCSHCLELQGSPPLRGDDETRNLGALRALGLTSRQMYAIANPRLYHRPFLTKWWLLLRTLLDNPHLGRHVRVIYQYGAIPSIPQPNPELTIALERYLHTPLALGEGVPTTSPPDHQSPLLRGNRFERIRRLLTRQENLIDILGSLLPNLETLDLRPVEYMPGTLNVPQALPRLKRLVFQPVNESRQFYFDIFTETARLQAPNLASLAAAYVSCCHPLLTAHEHLAELRLEDCMLDSPILEMILQACPALRRFEYSARRLQHGHFHFSPHQAQEKLVRLVPQLKVLRLDLNDAVPSPVESVFGGGEMISSLTDLTRLEDVSLSTRCLIPLLPPSSSEMNDRPSAEEGQVIEHLHEETLTRLLPTSIRFFRLECFRDCGGALLRLRRAVDRLASPEARLRLGSLERVRVVSDAEGGAVEGLREVFEGSGVEFDLGTSVRSEA